MHSTEAGGHAGAKAHVAAWGTLAAVFVALAALTVLTVTAAHLPLGPLESWTALGIATLKASLVAAYFMHLKYDKGFHALIFLGALLFVGLFLGLTLMDVGQYQPEVETYWEQVEAPSP